MPKDFTRKPLGNFFIKRDLQTRLIVKIVLSVVLATIVFAATLVATYQITYRDAAFYQVTLSTGQPEIGDRLQIVNIILPSLLISALVNVVLAFFVGMYASRKYAVPIYKLEQWASLLLDGNMAAKLRFREKEEMQELSTKCNRLSDKLRGQFTEIKKQIESLKERGVKEDELAKIADLLAKVELEAETIEVHTTFARVADMQNQNGEDSGKE